MISPNRALAILSISLLGTIAVLSGSGCGGPDEPDTGSACTSTDECEESLACVLGRCRPECLGYRDCALGSACLEDTDTGMRACRLPEEGECESDAACPDGTECAEGRCRARCTSAESCGGTACLVDAGGLCEDPADTRITCDDETYCGSGICDDVLCDEDLGMSLGATLTCSVRLTGEVDCAGSDLNDLLGDGAMEEGEEIALRPFLQPIALDEPAQLVSVGEAHACVALFTGEVRCWGRADRGQTGAAGAAGFPMLALPAPADELGVIDELALGAHHGCVRRASGIIECWGDDGAGQLGDEAVHPACASGDPCSAAPVPLAGIEDVIDLDAGRDATCAVRESGAVVCWGRSDTGLLGAAPEGTTTCMVGGATVGCRQTPLAVPTIERAIAISVGAEHACTIDEDGVVWCWGGNASGQAGAAGAGVAAPTEVELPLGAYVIDAGRAHTCAVTFDDRVWCWGANDVAQLGRSGGAGGATPAMVGGLPPAIDVVSGPDHVCARTLDGETWCWGRDAEAQLADGEPGTGGEAPPRRALRSPPGGP